MVISFALFAATGEEKFSTNVIDFFYYYMVTATTVGYGDLSPGTPAGRLAASLFVLPGAIAIFTATLGKILTGVSTIWRNRMRGLGDYSDRKGHVVVLGWQDGSTKQILRLLADERDPKEPATVLVAKDLSENPLSDCADFVRTERLSDTDVLDRAGILMAKTVIVRGNNDDETLAAALMVEDHAPQAHVVAYFNDDRTAESLRQRHPRIEAIGSLSEELISRAARDPGASVVAARLLSVANDDTSFSLKVPALGHPVPYGDVFAGMKRQHKVTVVGLTRDGVMDLNCADNVTITGGESLHYIAGGRLDPHAVDWAKLGATA